MLLMCNFAVLYALTIVALWGSACVYHGLVGNESVVTDLWGTA